MAHERIWSRSGVPAIHIQLQRGDAKEGFRYHTAMQAMQAETCIG